MDMPAIVSEYFPGINMQQVNEAVEKYQPAWQIISHTWDMKPCRKSCRDRYLCQMR